MLTRFLHDHRLTLHLVVSGPADEDGVPTSTEVDVPLEGWNVQGATTKEAGAGGATVVLTDTWRASGPLFELPAGATLNANDEVTWLTPPALLTGVDETGSPRPLRLKLDGSPITFNSGARDHVELVLVKG